MGIFKSYGDLKTMTKEIADSRPPGSASERALERVQAANAQIAEMAARATAPPMQAAHPHDGTGATATITGLKDTGQQINHQPIVDIDTVVLVPGRAPFPATHREVVPLHLLARFQVGATMGIRIGNSPADATIDWARC